MQKYFAAKFSIYIYVSLSILSTICSVKKFREDWGNKK